MARCENCMLQIPGAQCSKLIKLCVTSGSEKSRCTTLHASDSRSAVMEINEVVYEIEINKVAYKLVRCHNFMLQIQEEQ